MKTLKKYYIKDKTYRRGEGYRYTVQIWESVDGGETFSYFGEGGSFRTKKEAEKHIAEQESSENRL